MTAHQVPDTKGRWWLERTLSSSRRAEMTEAQRLERREFMVNWRIVQAEEKLATTRNKRVVKILKEWFRGEVMRDAQRQDGKPLENMREWIVREFREALLQFFKGPDQSSVIESVVRAEVGKSLAGTIGYSGLNNQEHGRRMREYIDRIVRDEVQKLVKDSITIDMRISGSVFQPAKSTRALRLPDDGE